MAEAIVLAAGLGENLSGAKALLMVDGVPLLVRHLAALRQAGFSRITVVVRPDVEHALREWVPQNRPVDWVCVETYSPAESIAAAVRRLRSVYGYTGLSEQLVLVTPVDVEPPSRSTLDALYESLVGDVLAATPQVGEQHSQLALVRGSVLTRYLIDPTVPLRVVLDELHDRRRRVALDDLGLDDLRLDDLRLDAARIRQQPSRAVTTR